MKRRRLRLLLLILGLELALFVAMQSTWHLRAIRESLFGPEGEMVTHLSFLTNASLKNWEEKIFKGRTEYEVKSEGDLTYLATRSRNASSGLYHRLKVEKAPDLRISWKWRAHIFPKKKNSAKLSNRPEDDFAIRLYVIFPGATFFSTDVIEYLWDDSLPPESFASSPFSGRVKLFVIRSGSPPEENNGWVTEERNVYDDYQKLFGRKPRRPIGAIGIMGDSDNTGTETKADITDILFIRDKKTALQATTKED